MLCERCGSIDIARSRSSKFDIVIRFFTGRKRFLCHRCGWTARRSWTEDDRPEWAKPKPPTQEATTEFDIDQFD